MQYRPGSLLGNVEEAAQRFHTAMAAVEDARAALYEQILAAHEEGISNAKIAAAAGLSRERVRQVVEASG